MPSQQGADDIAVSQLCLWFTPGHQSYCHPVTMTVEFVIDQKLLKVPVWTKLKIEMPPHTSRW